MREESSAISLVKNENLDSLASGSFVLKEYIAKGTVVAQYSDKSHR